MTAPPGPTPRRYLPAGPSTDPADPAAREFAIDLLIAGASFVDNYGTGPDTFVPRTIAGREVKVGTAAMIGQSEHIRGLPYLVEADGFSFVVVTDDPDWAEEAIAALPD